MTWDPDPRAPRPQQPNPGYPVPGHPAPGYPPSGTPLPGTPLPGYPPQQGQYPGQYTGQPGQYPPPAATPQPVAGPYPQQAPEPAGPSSTRSRAVIPVAVVVVLLALGLVGTGASWMVRQRSAKQEITSLKADHAAYEKKKADEAAARAARIAAADLPVKFEAVKTANDKLVAEVNAWGARSDSEQLRTIHTSQELRSRCLESVIAYNQAAAPFSSEERGDLPSEIDMSDTLYDCLTDNWSVST